MNDEKWVWHQRLGHANWRLISKLSKLSLVKGLPNLNYHSDVLYGSCRIGKISKTSFKPKNIVSTSRPLELLHIDLFGPVSTASINGKKYGLVIVDDYSRWTWVKFLRVKDDAYDVFTIICTQVQSEKSLMIFKIRSDHGGEFENEPFATYCEDHGIVHEFSAPRTPQQNGVVERKNKSLQEMARTMMHETKLAKHFLAEVVNTTCYIQNRIYIRPILNKTTYELFRGRKPNISYFHQFGCTCYILDNKAYKRKFDAKACKRIFIGYSERLKAYRVYNFETNTVKESIHVTFDDKEHDSKMSEQYDSYAGVPYQYNNSEPQKASDANETSESELEEVSVEASPIEASEGHDDISEDDTQTSTETNEAPKRKFKYKSSHPEDLILGNKESPRKTKSDYQQYDSLLGLISMIKPKSVDEALSDDGWIVAMQDEQALIAAERLVEEEARYARLMIDAEQTRIAEIGHKRLADQEAHRLVVDMDVHIVEFETNKITENQASEEDFVMPDQNQSGEDSDKGKKPIVDATPPCSPMKTNIPSTFSPIPPAIQAALDNIKVELSEEIQQEMDELRADLRTDMNASIDTVHKKMDDMMQLLLNAISEIKKP
ncbi:hypothetical protein P8452_61580 [Trifolium repens]|nr:hypothetical protein P8452_61580 [Trifolium repens]